MIVQTFEHSVHVKDAHNVIRDISSIEDALQFLAQWPEHRRGSIYDVASRACCFARDDRVPIDVARSAFASFARSAGILRHTPVPIEPWMIVPKRGPGMPL
ncbi:hypothetical protein Amn_pb00190 (plasmid) [Aminobacter sp. Y103A]|uniref:DUF982 domain-containing protein n=1 Tax=Aminobacter sp. Y103A TaxID=1870862 RepID=UPI002573195B|nr:DUF982 domain-containing protein [Aminobacter sp. SS-2016]BBD41028.1 hypothetical protein Amn_pb00190 [Aminobacter sp. SS-2016]